MSKEKLVIGGLASAAALVAGSHGALAQDWTGPYVGVSVGTSNGALPWLYPDDNYLLEKGPVKGAFVGARMESGGYLVGAEVAYSGRIGGDAAGDSSYPEEYSFSSLIDTKLSIGKAIGKSLVYGFAGLSTGNVTADGSGNNYTAFGANFGAGVDYMVNDKFSVGAEYTRRTMSGYDAIDANNGTLALRASFHF